MAGEWLALFRSLSEGGTCSDSSNSFDSSLKKGPVSDHFRQGKAIEAIEAIGTKAAEERQKAAGTNGMVERRDMAARWEAQDGWAFSEELFAHREFYSGHARATAERLAWGEMQNKWHMLHGERVPKQICAGCRRPIGIGPVLPMIDGNVVHAQGNHECLIQYGARWRGAATRALWAMGFKQPNLR
jgi:hypothetical protein